MKIKIYQLFQNKFFQGGVFLTLSSFLGGFLNYLFNSLSGKVLGPSGYGEIAALFSYLLIFSVPMQVITTDIIRRLGQKGKERFNFLTDWEYWFWQKIFRWKFLLVPYFLLLAIIPRFTSLSLVSSLTLLILLFFSFISVLYSSSLQGLHLFFWCSIISIIVTLIKLLGPILVFFHIDGLSTIMLCLIFSSLVGTVLAKIVLDLKRRRLPVRRISPEKRIFQVLITKSIFVIALSSLSVNFVNNLDVIFVKKFFSPEMAGAYGAWNLFSKIIFYIAGPLTSLSFVFFSDKEQERQHKKILFLTITSFVFVGIGLYSLYYFFGKTLLLLIFNQKYLIILPWLAKASVFGILYTLIVILNGFFIAKNSFLALIIAVFVPFYGAGLLLLGKSLDAVININIIFSFIVAIAYLFSFLIISVDRGKGGEEAHDMS